MQNSDIVAGMTYLQSMAGLSEQKLISIDWCFVMNLMHDTGYSVQLTPSPFLTEQCVLKVTASR